MEPISTPRVSGRYIESYINKNVMIVGKVIQVRGTEALIDADGQISINLTAQEHLTPGNACQIIGKVNTDLSIKVLTSKDLGDNVDYNVVQSVVDATQQYREMFVFDN
ncbi:hypothetical protein PFICI_07439 [Pestalotiopsis fici W106-1]|uniref:Replication factor A protein 3 n=1 Tax=Pestalotiopsis fici (strain W106-1 / CGMCC3.15140) TaxID=1229662 RepID=W3X1F6_PESFW|nr:uncharacterized protein PFICI_07439 [Pestalotiopsis fici W106-1]ETS79910.1 hypothetical protein PFICI_07439 [Pestalotiopsis fici W106-1]